MKTKYQAVRGISGSIEKVEILKESEKSVWYSKDDCRRKMTDYNAFFDTFEEAKEWLIIWADNRQKRASRVLESSIKDLNYVLELKDEQ